mmetsp:Transcript_65610/g.148060  ORF Transcript_65610/g.148060 Transcript_65610/m.148060 type:complete len:97 (+) Transcript_65610:274-564(+)
MPRTVFSALREQENRDVANKLAFATACMATIPVATFFLLKTGFGFNDMWSGFAAVAVANCIIAGYVIMAYFEDSPDASKPEEEVPAVGIWAARKTD